MLSTYKRVLMTLQVSILFYELALCSTSVLCCKTPQAPGWAFCFVKHLCVGQTHTKHNFWLYWQACHCIGLPLSLHHVMPCCQGITLHLFPQKLQRMKKVERILSWNSNCTQRQTEFVCKQDKCFFIHMKSPQRICQQHKCFCILMKISTCQGHAYH